MERRGFTLKEKLNKKGVSPVIATVLLVAMVIVLALIVFLWFRSLSKEYHYKIRWAEHRNNL